jgi:hypothetical protein
MSGETNTMVQANDVFTQLLVSLAKGARPEIPLDMLSKVYCNHADHDIV